MSKLEQIREKIISIYPNKELEVIKALEHEPAQTFRINTLKSTRDILDSLESNGFEFEPACLPNTFKVITTSDTHKLSETEECTDGFVYIQGLSSIACVYALNPQKEENILDLCAAPGSKTSLIASLMQNTGTIVAVEKNRTRVQKMQANLSRLDVANTQIVHEDGYTLPTKYSEYVGHFDRVLVDAPCSNEGYIVLDDPQTYAFWNKNKYKDMVWQQKGLIKSGFEMLRPGGVLIYSTCTFSVEENEGIVDWLLNTFDIAEVVEIELDLLQSVMPGKTSWKSKSFSPVLAKTVRVLPNGIFRPFFIAKITKKG